MPREAYPARAKRIKASWVVHLWEFRPPWLIRGYSAPLLFGRRELSARFGMTEHALLSE